MHIFGILSICDPISSTRLVYRAWVSKNKGDAHHERENEFEESKKNRLSLDFY